MASGFLLCWTSLIKETGLYKITCHKHVECQLLPVTQATLSNPRPLLHRSHAAPQTLPDGPLASPARVPMFPVPLPPGPLEPGPGCVTPGPALGFPEPSGPGLPPGVPPLQERRHLLQEARSPDPGGAAEMLSREQKQHGVWCLWGLVEEIEVI